MKSEARVLGIDDAPFDKYKHKTALVVGCFYRGSKLLEGVMSTRIKVDGEDSTKKVAEMINRSKFKPQIQAGFIDGLNMAGFNILNINQLNKATGIPIISIVRRMPDLGLIIQTLERLGLSERVKLIRAAGKPKLHKKIFFQYAGLSETEAREFIEISTSTAHIPEAIRAAHLIGAGIVKGESSGRA